MRRRRAMWTDHHRIDTRQSVDACRLWLSLFYAPVRMRCWNSSAHRAAVLTGCALRDQIDWTRPSLMTVGLRDTQVDRQVCAAEKSHGMIERHVPAPV